MLSTGKGVGTLCKDILTFLNSVAIAKMCKNAREILNLPDESFSLVFSSAELADGHRILRTTEIMAACENDMRYSLNGAITLETAVIKCALPQDDYNIDALISRVAALEKRVEEGVKVAPSIPKANVQAPPAARAEEGLKESASKTAPPVGEARKNNPVLEAMEDDGPFAQPNKESKASKEDAPSLPRDEGVQPTLWESAAPAPASAGSLTDEQKSKVFAKLLRMLRTTRRNAVLFTLCMDLENYFEGDTLVLVTDTEAVFRALTREENARFVREALAELGVFSHEVRLKPKGESKWESAERRLRENFKGIDIDVK